MNGRRQEVALKFLSAFIILLIIVIIFLFIVKPTFYARGLGEIPHETIEDPFSEGNAGYVVFKQEFTDWCKILLPLAGFVLGRMNGRRK